MARRILEQFHPQVFLLDRSQPDTDGYGLARLLAHRATLDTVCVVALPGRGHQTVKQRALDAGCDMRRSSCWR